MTWGPDSLWYPRDVCDLDEAAQREPRFEDALALPAPREEPPHVSIPLGGAAPLTRPYIHVKRTKTRGWRVVLHTTRSHVPVLMARGLTEEQARAVGRAHAGVHDCGIEIDQ